MSVSVAPLVYSASIKSTHIIGGYVAIVSALTIAMRIIAGV